MLLDIVLKKKKYLIMSMTLLVLVAIAILCFILLKKNEYYRGIAVEEINISGLDKNEARSIVSKNLEDKYGAQSVNLVYGEKVWNIKLKDISYNMPVEQALDNAYRIGRSGNLINRLLRISSLRFKNLNITAYTEYDTEAIRNMLYNIKKEIDREEKDASVSFNKGVIKLENDTTGLIFDIDKNIKLVENHIRERKFDNINLTVDEKKGKILYNDIKEINSILSTFSTSFNAQDKNRTHNIILACSKINGIVLKPKDIFSMDRALGTRTLQNGYLEAPVIFKNELIPGAGGGVCQVTTTLYGAALRSSVDIIERQHHSLPLGYVELGQDATIAENYIDLKIQNNKDYSVCISAEVVGNTMYVRFLGFKDKDSNIKIRSVVQQELLTDSIDYIVDNTLADDQVIIEKEVKKGYKVIVYRDYYDKNGKLSNSEKISEDVYNPVKAQVRANQNYINSTK